VNKTQQSHLFLILRILVSASLLYLVLREIDVTKLQAILHGSRWYLIAVAILLYCAGQMLCAYRWKLLMSPVRLDLPYWRVAALYFLGMFFNFFFPTLIGGDAVKIYYFSREAGEITRPTTTILMDRSTGMCALLLVAVVVAGVAKIHLAGVALFPILLGVFLLFGLANFILFFDPTYHLLAIVFQRVRLAKLEELTKRFHAAFSSYRRSSDRLLAAVALSLVFDIAMISFVYLAAMAIDWTVPFKYFCVFIPITALISMVPVTLYGLGLREFSFVYLFSQVGVAREAGLLLAFLWLFVILVSSLPGAIIYIFYRRGEPSMKHVVNSA
jgi:hypothetical protein